MKGQNQKSDFITINRTLSVFPYVVRYYMICNSFSNDLDRVFEA